MVKINKTKKIERTLIVLVLLFAFLAPTVTNHIKFPKGPEKPLIPWYDPELADFLYDDTIDRTTYNFNAYNESYIMCNISNTDYTTFTFNSTVYNVSYGLNIFPVDFGVMNVSYSISISQDDIDNNIFDWIIVEPLFIEEEVIEVNTVSTTDIVFDAGGPISILVQPVNFSYNSLYMEIDGTVINEVYDIVSHDEVDPAILAYTIFSGSYIQYDLFLDPGQHTLKFKGNGTVNFKVMVSSDWDMDFISDVIEVQNSLFWNFYDPTESTIWGYYTLGSTTVITDEDDIMDKIIEFIFYIPEKDSDESHINLVLGLGEISNITIDGDDLLYKGDTMISGRYPKSKYLGCFSEGFHRVSFIYDTPFAFNSYFTCNGLLIPIHEQYAVTDSDSDGLIDLNEITIGSDPFVMDTDSDGLIDGIDDSPLVSMEFGNDEIYQVVMDHDSDKNTMITISIERPEEGDYYTGEPMIWKENTDNAIEVSIIPTLRVFGNQSINTTELETTWNKDVVTYNLTGSVVSDVYGDNIPTEDEDITEYDMILPSIGKNSFEYAFTYTKGHDAKDDSIIDIRFDVVWSVFQTDVNITRLIHYYDFDDNINIQFITKFEIANISYILASPDSMIEDEILWNLIRNPELGSFSDFGISEVDDIDGSGNIDFLDLADQLIDDREQNPISVDLDGNINETEVLYLSGEIDTYDILLKVNNSITWDIVPDAMKYLNEVEVFFSSRNIGSDEEINLLSINVDTSALGSSDISFVRSWRNYSLDDTGGFEKRVNIIEFPVEMNLIDQFDDADILEVKYVNGDDIPQAYFPETLDEINYDKVRLLNTTIIEKRVTQNGKPSITFDLENDEHKEIEETRRMEIPLSTLIFTEYSFDVAAFLSEFKRHMKTISGTWTAWVDHELMEQMLENLNSFYIGTGYIAYPDDILQTIESYNVRVRELFGYKTRQLPKWRDNRYGITK